MPTTIKEGQKDAGFPISMHQTTSTIPETPRSRSRKEMEEYKRIPTIDGDDDPLLRRKCHNKKFQLLSRLARNKDVSAKPVRL